MAARQLGLATVPCLVVDTEGDALVQQIVENVQRRELGDMEKARAFERLRERLAAAQPELRGAALREAIGQRLGLSGRTVARYLSLLDLPAEVQALLDSGELTVTQAQHLLAITPSDRQIALAQVAVQRGLSAAQISRACSRLASNAALPVEAAVRAVDAPSGEQQQSDMISVAPTPAPALPRLARPSSADADQEDGAALEAEFWPDDAVVDGKPQLDNGDMPRGPVTQDRARVFRIGSLDSFVDEVARLTRCVQDGDLAHLVDGDPQGAVKLELAARQIGFLARAVSDMVDGKRR